nr:hypothetical protein [Tanacetum cinerariifolium]
MNYIRGKDLLVLKKIGFSTNEQADVAVENTNNFSVDDVGIDIQHSSVSDEEIDDVDDLEDFINDDDADDEDDTDANIPMIKNHKHHRGNLSTLKELLKEPANRDLIKPILLYFNDDGQYTDEEVEVNKRNDKGKAMANDEDLRHRMPTNVKIYDRTCDQEDHKPFHQDRKSRRMAYARMVSNVPTDAGWQGKGMV